MVIPPVRLWIEYILIGAVIVFAGLAITTKMESLKHENQIDKLSGKVELAETRLSVVEGVNEAQRQVIQDLALQRSMDGESIVKLMDTYQKLALADRKLRSQLSELEKNDEARSYLDSPVPGSVGCLWDDSCSTDAIEAPGDSGLSPGGSPAPLPTSPKEEARSEP